MLLYALRRLLYLVPVAFGVSLLVFALVHLAPGDPISAIVPPDAPKEVVDKLKEYYGFDKPLPVQYFRWLARDADRRSRHLDRHRPAGGGRSGVGLRQHHHPGHRRHRSSPSRSPSSSAPRRPMPSRGSSTGWSPSISLMGVSVPHFWLAIVLVIIFSVELGVLPPMGLGPENSTGWRFDWPHLKHMILPTIALSVIPLGVMTRTVRSTVKEMLSMEFVTALQAKGMRDGQILRHVSRMPRRPASP